MLSIMGQVPTSGQAVKCDTSPLPVNGHSRDAANMLGIKISDHASPVAHEVYRRMLAAGLNQKSLAVRAGLNETYVRDLFKARSLNPQASQLARLAVALDCELSDLTNPGRLSDRPKCGDRIKDGDELALVKFWRGLTDDGRRRMFTGLGKAPLEPGGS